MYISFLGSIVFKFCILFYAGVSLYLAKNEKIFSSQERTQTKLSQTQRQSGPKMYSIYGNL